MNKQATLTKCALVPIILGFLFILIGSLFTFPNDGFVKWILPVFMGILGLIFSIVAFTHCRAKTNIVLIIVSIILMLWFWIFQMGGTLLFGV